MYPKRWFVLITVGIGTLLSSLNTSMTNTILPVIEKDLRISMSQSEWIVLIYLLVLTLCLLPMGRLADLFGYRPVFLSGFVLYMGAAILCGVSGDYAWLLVGRVLLALAGAMILSVGPALISTSFPAEQRGQVLGLQAVMTYIGLSAGPVLGGWITDWLGWPFTFYLTLPFAVIGLALGIWSVPVARVAVKRAVDPAGILLFMLMMGSITVLLNGNSITRYRGEILLGLLVCFVVAAVLFVRVEQKHPQPMIQLALFRIKNFGYGTVGAAFNYLCFFLALYLLPYYFSFILHESSAITGTYLTISPLIMMVCAPIAGRVSDKMGVRRIITFGMTVSAISLAVFALMASASVHQLTSTQGGDSHGAGVHVLLIVGLVLAGLGTGSFAAPNNSAILGAAPREQQGVASGTLATFRYIGMMAGITLGGSLFGTLEAVASKRQMDAVHPQLAFLSAFVWVMWIGALAGGIGLLCALQVGLRKPQKQERMI